MRLAVLMVATAFASSPAFAADQLKFGPPPGWVVPQSIPQQSTKAATAPMAILLNDSQIRFDDGKTTSFTEIALKVQSPEGLAAGNIAFPWQPSTDTVTVNKLHIIRDGKVIDVLKGGQTFTVARRETNMEAAMLDGTLTANIQPEGLQVGDIIDLAVTAEHLDPVMKGHVESLFGVWGSAPIELGHVTLSWNDRTNLSTRELLLPDPKRTRLDGFTVLDLTGKAVDPPILPKDAPARFRLGRGGEATDFSSWDDVAALMKPLFENASMVPAAGPLRDELESIRKIAKTSKQKTEMALALVENRVRYVALLMGTGGYVPESAETTWSRRYGDCKAKSALLVALLRELGIQAEPVLVSTTIGDALPGRLPMVSYFNHVIVRANVDGKEYWLDGTRTGDRDLEQVPVPEFEWGLPLVADAKLVPIVPKPLTKPQVETAINLDASAGVFAPAPFTAGQTFRGDSAIAVNAVYSKLSSEQLDQALRGYWHDKYDYVDIKTVSWTFDEKLLEGRLSMTGMAKIEWTDGWFYVPMSTIAYKPDFTRAEGPFHDAPFAVSFPDWEVTHVQVKLPDAFAEGQKIPPAVKETLAGIEYVRTASTDRSALTVESSERALQKEIAYKDALAAAPRLKALADDDVYLQLPAAYQPSQADIASMRAATPASADGFVQKGRVLASSGKLDEAIAAFSQALALDAQSADALAARANAYSSTQDFTAAERDTEALEKLRPGEAGTAVVRGYLEMARGHYDEAEKSFSRVLQSVPDNGYARLARAQARLEQGQSENALSDFNAVLAREPSNRDALSGRATAYHAVGEDDLALADTNSVLKEGKPDAPLRLLRANIFRHRGKHDLVVREAELLIEENPKSDFALVAAGKIFSAEGERSKAMDAMNRAIALHPYAYIYMNRSQVRAPTDYAGRMADVEEALKLEPNSADALEMKARLLMVRGKISDAIAAYDAALASDPADALNIRRERAVALYKDGKTAEAEKELVAIRAQSTKPQDLNSLCWDKATAGIMLESAVADCQEALRLRPDASNFKDSLGMALLRLGKLDEALRTYSEVIDKAHLAPSYMGRAFVYALKGDMQHAQADRAEALNRDRDVEAEFAEYGLVLSADQGQKK